MQLEEAHLKTLKSTKRTRTALCTIGANYHCKLYASSVTRMPWLSTAPKLFYSNGFMLTFTLATHRPSPTQPLRRFCVWTRRLRSIYIVILYCIVWWTCRYDPSCIAMYVWWTRRYDPHCIDLWSYILYDWLYMTDILYMWSDPTLAKCNIL